MPIPEISRVADTNPHSPDSRRRHLSIMARTAEATLEAAWRELGDGIDFRFLREPETGLCLVRARAGGTGMRFNLGEMTIARCAVRLETGEIGIGYVAGRSTRHAELVALFDAMLQRPAPVGTSLGGWIDRLEEALVRRRREMAAKHAPSRVEFLTVVRGED